jgi:hypothetical protein
MLGSLFDLAMAGYFVYFVHLTRACDNSSRVFVGCLCSCHFPQGLLHLLAMYQSIIDADHSGYVWDQHFFCSVEDYWVADSVFKECVTPDSDVVFPTADEEFPAFF